MSKKEQGDNETFVYAEIPLSLIDVEGQSVREMQDDDHVAELAMSISRHGLLQPINVEEKNGRYQLLAGKHRLAAFYRLKKKTIPGRIKKEYTGPVKAIALVENICRLNMSLEEEVEAVNYLGEIEKMSVSQIQDITGKSRDWVLKRMAVRSTYEDIKRLLFEGKINIRQSEVLSRIEDEGSRKYCSSVVIQQGLSASQAEELVKLYYEHSNVADAVQAGLATAEEIQKTKIPTRKCDNCGKTRPLMNIQFVGVCIEGCENVKEEKEG